MVVRTVDLHPIEPGLLGSDRGGGEFVYHLFYFVQRKTSRRSKASPGSSSGGMVEAEIRSPGGSWLGAYQAPECISCIKIGQPCL